MMRMTLRPPAPCWWRDPHLFADGGRFTELHQLGQITLDGVIGHPAIGMGLPADWPRLVREMSSSWEALRASS